MVTPDDSSLGEGTMLAHYRVEAPLGSGAMGTVYKAWDTSLERPVAAKVLHGRVAEEPEIVRRFEREARAAARVNHPNLTHVYFVGNDPERHFFVMEYVPGESLLDHVEAHGPMPFERVIDVLSQAARGIAAAHEGGVIHRDIKPSNLMLLPEGSVKVTDFGLSKSLQGDIDATGAGRIMGTPRYMSPEQCRGEPVGAATDAYSLGLVGFYLLAGRHAFDGDSLGKVLSDQMNAPLPDLAAIRSDLPPAARRLLDRLCAKTAADRPQTMDEVRDLIEAVRPRELDLAPLATRATAFVGDILSLVIPALALATVFAFVESLGVSGDVMDILTGVVFIGTMTAISVWAEWRFGGLPGKLAFGVRVVHEAGTRAPLTALVTRVFLRVPVIVLVALVPLIEPLLGDTPVPGLVSGAVAGIQFLALVAGAVCYVVLDQRTLSDVFTRTRVVLYRTGDPDPTG